MVRSSILASALVLASATYEEFKEKYGKEYNGEEDEQHRATYEENMAYYAEINAQDLGFELGENQFADLTQEQYRVAAGLGYIPPDPAVAMPILEEIVHDGVELASSVDWSKHGAVTPVKNQGQCGSCWAFSTTGGIEGAWQIATGSLLSLSEQQLTDCACQGCQGGNAAYALRYESGVYVATEASYAYTGRRGQCKTGGYNSGIPPGGVSGFSRVGSSKNDLKAAIQRQPISIAIEADQRSFQGYKKGILSSGCGTSLDHAVLAVGYGKHNGHGYWLVKNSWGHSWGEHGYIRISSETNQCGVLNDAIAPKVSASVAV